MAKKTKKPKVHATYNKKSFLAPESIYSMAAVFTKIHSDGIAIIRISDCNRTIKLWNDLNEKVQVKEMLTKITNIQNALEEFKKEVEIKLNKY
jgi:hypothetical protein